MKTIITRSRRLRGTPFTSRLEQQGVNILNPITFAGLLIGSMLPYWFSALTMKSVGIDHTTTV